MPYYALHVHARVCVCVSWFLKSCVCFAVCLWYDVCMQCVFRHRVYIETVMPMCGISQVCTTINSHGAWILLPFATRCSQQQHAHYSTMGSSPSSPIRSITLHSWSLYKEANYRKPPASPQI